MATEEEMPRGCLAPCSALILLIKSRTVLATLCNAVSARFHRRACRRAPGWRAVQGVPLWWGGSVQGRRLSTLVLEPGQRGAGSAFERWSLYLGTEPRPKRRQLVCRHGQHLWGRGWERLKPSSPGVRALPSGCSGRGLSGLGSGRVHRLWHPSLPLGLHLQLFRCGVFLS